MHPKRMARILFGEAALVLRKIVPLPKDPQSPALARRSVEEVIAAAGVANAEKNDLVIIASELVTNAIAHGSGPVTLSVSCEDSEITVEVSDGDPRVELIDMRPVDATAVGGRGLRIVAALADRWGTRRSHRGKTVWATKAVRLASR